MGQKTNRMYDISAPPSDSICLVPYACMEWVLRQAAHDGHEDQREYQDGRRSHLLRIGNISLAVSQPSIPGCRHCRTSRCRPHRQQPPRSACERLQSLAFLPLLAPPAPVLKGCSGCLGPDFQLRPCCGAASQGCSGASNLRCSPTRKQNKKRLWQMLRQYHAQCRNRSLPSCQALPGTKQRRSFRGELESTRSGLLGQARTAKQVRRACEALPGQDGKKTIRKKEVMKQNHAHMRLRPCASGTHGASSAGTLP